MIKFSLILNTRNRPQLLSNLIDSIIWKTANTAEIELLISADDDDIATQMKFNKYDPQWGGFLPEFASIEYIPRERNLHKRINNLVARSKGEFIWLLNDDCLIETQNWDECYTYLKSFKDGLVLGNVACTSVDKEETAQYSSFPIVSRKIYDLLGHIISPALPGLGGDVYLWRLFSRINRIITLPISVRHVLHESVKQVINCDTTAAEMRQATKIAGINCWTMSIDKDVEILKNAILY